MRVGPSCAAWDLRHVPRGLCGLVGAGVKLLWADLAVAIVDELETPRHLQRRFTVAH